MLIRLHKTDITINCITKSGNVLVDYVGKQYLMKRETFNKLNAIGNIEVVESTLIINEMPVACFKTLKF